jgi:hypothetical protein
VKTRRLRLSVRLAVAAALVPGQAMACATCVSSAFGDQTYNWPYLALILMPFLVTGALGAVLYHHRGALQSSDASPAPSDAPPAVETFCDKEMT